MTEMIRAGLPTGPDGLWRFPLQGRRVVHIVEDTRRGMKLTQEGYMKKRSFQGRKVDKMDIRLHAADCAGLSGFHVNK